MDVEAELTMVSDAAVPMFAQPVVPQGAEPVQQMACPHVAQPLQALQPAVAGIEQQPAVVQPVPAVPMVTQPEQAVKQPVKPLDAPGNAPAPVVNPPKQPAVTRVAEAGVPVTPPQQVPVAAVAQPVQPLQAVNAMVAPPPAVVQPAQPLQVPPVTVTPPQQPALPAAQPAQPLQAAVVQPVQPLTVTPSPQPAPPAVPAAPLVQPAQPAAAPMQAMVNAQPPNLPQVKPDQAVVPAPVVQQPQQKAQEAASAETKEREQAQKELQAMGWLTGNSCRPQASPHGTTQADASADNGSDKGDAMRRQKSQIFQPPSDVHMGPPAPPGSVVVKLEPAQNGMRQPLPSQSSKPADTEYSRRAAANLLGRIKKNPSRLEGLPSLRKMVFDEEKKNDLISMLCENGGNLEQVQVHLQQQEERGRYFSAKKKALRFTKKQMEDSYGKDAEQVMKYKESIGMIEEDENNPNGIVYLIAQREDEEDSYTRTGWDLMADSFKNSL